MNNPYQKTLNFAADHMVDDDYYSRFDAPMKKGMKWLPWVGADYHAESNAKILIVGMSTYYNEDTEWRDFCDTDSRPNHRLIGSMLPDCGWNIHGKGSLQPIPKMFIRHGAQCEYNRLAVRKFWRSVAFLNFCQRIVKKHNEFCPCDEIENSKAALLAAIRILEPDMVLAWTTVLSKIYDENTYEITVVPKSSQRKRRVLARIIDDSPPVVGIVHPSRWWNQKPLYKIWMDFLLNDSPGKKPTATFLNHLKKEIRKG